MPSGQPAGRRRYLAEVDSRFGKPYPISCNISREPMPTFYDRFVECVEHWPGNVALEIQRHDKVESYTYAEVRRMAESIGIDTRRLFSLAFALGSGLAALGGGLGADILAIYPGYATEYLV